MTSVETLKPCPFTGKAPRPGLFEADDIGGWFVSSGQCLVWGSTEAKAIAAWNTRPNSDADALRDLAERSLLHLVGINAFMGKRHGTRSEARTQLIADLEECLGVKATARLSENNNAQ